MHSQINNQLVSTWGFSWLQPLSRGLSSSRPPRVREERPWERDCQWLNKKYLPVRLIFCYFLQYILLLDLFWLLLLFASSTVSCSTIFLWLNQVLRCITYHQIPMHQSIQVYTSQLIELCFRNLGISRKWPSFVSYLQNKMRKKIINTSKITVQKGNWGLLTTNLVFQRSRREKNIEINLKLCSCTFCSPRPSIFTQRARSCHYYEQYQ